MDDVEVKTANIQCYDDYYDKPQWWFKFRYDTQVKRKTILWLLKKAKRRRKQLHVLEYGFGSGAVLFSFNSSCEIHGLEISASAILKAKEIAKRKGYKEYSFTKIDGNETLFPSEYFDLVIASHVLEHVDDDCAILNEIYRVLKPEGIVVILVPINERYSVPHHVRHYSFQSLKEIVEQYRFQIIFSRENEYLFYLVEKFYYEHYNTKWKMKGALIAAIFNVLTSQIPFFSIRIIDSLLLRLHFKPRQLGIVLCKINLAG